MATYLEMKKRKEGEKSQSSSSSTHKATTRTVDNNALPTKTTKSVGLSYSEMKARRESENRITESDRIARTKAAMLANDIGNRAIRGAAVDNPLLRSSVSPSKRLYSTSDDGLRRRAAEIAAYTENNPNSGINSEAINKAVDRLVNGGNEDVIKRIEKRRRIDEATKAATQTDMSLEEIDRGIRYSSNIAKGLQDRLNKANVALVEMEQSERFNTPKVYKENDAILKQNLGQYKNIRELENALKNAKREVERYESEKKKYQYGKDITDKYSPIQTRADFTSLAQQGATTLPNYYSVAEVNTMPETDVAALYINSDEDTREHIMNVYEKAMFLTDYNYLDEQQKRTYNAIRVTEGEDAGFEYLSAIAPTLTRKGYFTQKEDITEKIQSNAGDAILQNVGSVVTSPLRGVDFLGATLDRSFGLNQDALGSVREYTMNPTNKSMVVRSATQEKIKNPTLRFAYNTGMSILDNLMNIAVTGGSSQAATLVLMGSGAASQTYSSAKAKGLTEDEALSLGLLSGGIEAATESIGLDNLFSIIRKEGGQAGLELVKSIASQVGAEGSEEILAEFGNALVDNLVSGDLSDFNRSIQYYIQQEGMSYEDAKKKATSDFFGQVVEAFFSGGLSGGVMGGGAVGINAINNAVEQNKIDKARGREILDIYGYDSVMDLAIDTVQRGEGKSERTLGRTIDQIKGKKSPSAYVAKKPQNAARLLDKSNNAIIEQTTRVSEIESNLKKNTGLSDNAVKKISRAMVSDIVNAKEFSEVKYTDLLKGYDNKENILGKISTQFDKTKAEYDLRVKQRDNILGGNASVKGAEAVVPENTNAVDIPEAREVVSQAEFDENADIRKLIETVKDNPMQVNAAMSIYSAARNGVSIETAVNETLNAQALSEEQRFTAFSAGRIAYNNERIQNIAKAPATVKSAKTGVVREYDAKGLNVKQRNTIGRSIRALDVVAKKYNKTVHVVNSIDQIPGMNGKSSAKVYRSLGQEGNSNAFFNTETGEYYIALDAVDKSYLYVAMHESVHDGAQNNKAGFENLATITREVLINNGYSAEKIDSVTDLEEFMCNTVPVILTDRATLDEFVSRVAGADIDTRTAFEKFINSIYEIIMEAYEALKNDPQWSQMEAIRNDLDGIKRMRDAYFEMLEGTTDGITIDPSSGAAVFSLKTAPRTEAEIEAAVNRLVEAGFEKESAEAWIESLTSVGGVIMQNMQTLDYESDARYTWLKKNSDYSQGSVDFNNNCPKRVEFTALFDRLQKEFPNTVFTAEDYEAIRQILIKHKIPVTCGPCFVEDRRQHLGEIAQQFIDQLNDGELAPKFTSMIGRDTYVPTQYDLVTYGGAQTLFKEHRGVYNAFIAFNNARGMASARLVEGMAEYNNQIKKWNKRTVTSKNNKGGLRIFSLSDADPRIMIDVIQIVIDSAEKGLMIQGYTKKPWFAKMIKDTGIKMLRSHIPLGTGVQKVNGKNMLVFDNVEGINTRDADYFDSTNSKTIGNNVIGINDQQIRVAMTTPMIDQIIPFHTGLKAEIRNKKKIGDWHNYRNSQTDKVAATGKKADKQINIYTDVLNAYEKAGKPIKNKVEFVQAFLDVCKERGLTPRFSEFLNVNEKGEFVYTEGYHKFLVDYKLFDSEGNILPQQPVQPIFDDAFNKKILNDYVKDSGVKVNRDDVYREIKDEVVGESVKFSKKSTKKTKHSSAPVVLQSGIYKDTDGNDVAVIGVRLVGRRTGKESVISILDEEIKKHIGSTFTIDATSEEVYVDAVGAGEYSGSTSRINMTTKELVVKTNATPGIKNIFKIAKFDTNKSDNKPNQPNHGARSDGGFNYYNSRFAVAILDDNQNVTDYNIFTVRIIVAVGKDGILRLHDMDNIKADRGSSLDKTSDIVRISALAESVSQPEQESQGKFSTKTDSDYLAAVNRGDMETAQKILDAYAIEKGFDVDENGDPDMLFHGTDSFGFTVPDTSTSDDQLTFWATPNMGVAGSYYRNSDYKVREIGKEKVTPKAERMSPYISAEKMVAMAKPYSNELGVDLSKVKPMKESAVMRKAEKHIRKAVESAKVVENGDFSNEIKRIAKKIIAANEKGTYEAWHRLLNNDSWGMFRDVTGVDFTTLDLPDNFNINRSDISKITDAHPDVFKMMYHAGDVYDAVYSDVANSISEEFDYDDLLLNYNEWASEKGIYAFYHKQSNPFIYDCEDAKWNKIKVPDEARADIGTETTNTRTLARWAFEHGYDAIRLDNVNDFGGWKVKDATKYATIWAFKNPQSQLKSADPVTYDDAGNVIPLSKRFNPKNDDIRFSKKTQPTNYRTDAEILKAAKGTTEAEKNALAMYKLNSDSLAQRTSNLLMLQAQMESAKRSDRAALAAQIRRAENDVQEFEARMNKLRDKQELQDILIRERVSEWGDFLSEFGVLPKGEQAAGTEENREIDVPAKTNKNAKVSRYARTILESKTIPDEMIDPIRSKILEGGLSYIPDSNANLIEMAMKRTEEDKISSAWDTWDMAVRGDIKKVDSSITALGEALLKRTAESGDAKQTVILAAELTEMFSRAGKVVQSAKLLKRMGVAGQIAYLDRTVASINRSIAQRGAKIAEKHHVKINEDLVNELLNAKTEAERDGVIGRIYQDIADQMPNNFVDKWNAWRYLAMLGNPLTHIRNVVGNAMFVPAIAAKNVSATIYEKLAKVAGAKFTPTKAIVVKKQYDSFAKNDFDAVKNELLSGGKYNDLDEIRAKQKVFGWKALETVRNFNFDMLEKEDGIFLRMHYRTALGQYLTANKIDLTMMSEETLGKARAYAMMEAQKATYRAASNLATILQNAGNRSNAVKFVLDSVVPFKKTPINILKSGINYSPVGLVTTMAKGLNSVIKQSKDGAGTMTMSEFIDGMAAGTVGTAVVALGYFLASLGGLVGGLGDDDEDRLRKLTGEQGYAIKIGNNTYTISWAAPISMPFLVGAALYDTVNEKQEWDASSVLQALSLISEPVVSLSMLDGIQSMLESAAYASDEERFAKVAESAISSYASQPFPTVLAQIARMIDPKQRSIYVDKNSGVPKGLQKIGQNIAKKIPGLSKLLMPSYNEWGEERKSGVGERIIENTVSPGYYSKVEYNSVETELMRLLEATGDGSVVPNTVSKKIGDKNLTREEYEAYVALKGQPSLNLLAAMIEADEYKGFADDAKVRAVQYAYEYVGELAKYSIAPEAGEPARWIMAIQNAADTPAEIADFVLQHTQEEYIDKNRKDAAWASFDNGNTAEMVEYIGEMRDGGKEDKDIWASVTSRYKDEYVELIEAGDTEGAKDLADKIKELGLKNNDGEAYASDETFKKWQFEADNGFAWEDRYDAYKNGDISASELKSHLMKTGGLTAEKAADKIAQIDFEVDHPELDGRISYSQYKRWQADGKSRNVPLDTFVKVAEYQDNGTSDSSRDQEEVANYIDSLTNDVGLKDALWCCFWKESTLKRKAPWHNN